jgi:hypothetical protein
MHADILETSELFPTDAGEATMAATPRRAAFEDRFERELVRLDRRGREPEAWEAESLLSALGAAAMKEFELACALVDSVRTPPSAPPPQAPRRQAMSIAALRRCFGRLCA